MKLIRNILKGASLTTALFVFQACYGTAVPYYGLPEVKIKVVDAEDGSPIKDATIKFRDREAGVQGQPWSLSGYSSDEGVLCMGIQEEMMGIEVEMLVSPADGAYSTKDTVVTNFGSEDITIKLRKQ